MYWIVGGFVAVVAIMVGTVLKWDRDETAHYCSCCGRRIPPGDVLCAECEKHYEDRAMGYYM